MRWLAVLALIACSAGPTQVGAQPSWRKSPTVQATQPVTFAPEDNGVARYNEAISAPASTPLGDATIAAVREAAVNAKLPVPIADARLFRACAELAQIVPEQGVVGYGLVEFALQRNGIIEPSPHLLVVWGDVDKPDEIVDELRPKLAEILADGATARLGIGAAKRHTADGTGAVVFALQGSGLRTQPIPRAVPANGSFGLDATIDARFRDPEVFVTHDGGDTERLPLSLHSGGASNGFSATVACGAHTGRQQIEIAASDNSGSTVLANFPVYCGTDPPAAMTLEASDDGKVADAGEAERRLLALVNRDRQAAGLAPLVWDDKIAEVARKHSEEMRETKVVAHISPRTGSAADRVHAANIKTAVVLENVARAYGIGEAHDGLMNSPGHRANIMSASATQIGIGVVLGEEVSGRREMFITQVFTRVPPTIDPGRGADDVRGKLQAAIPNVANEARLTSIAQQLADALASGKTREQAWPTVRKQVDALGNGYTRIGSVVTAVSDLATLDGKSLIGDSHPDEIGVGVAQGPHPEIGENAIYVVVLLAEKKK